MSWGCADYSAQAPAPAPATAVVAEAAEIAEPEAPPAPNPIALGAFEPVTLDPGGRATVEARVDRNGNEGPLEVRIEGAPAGLAAKAEAIAAGKSSCQLELAAEEKLGEEATTATLHVVVKGASGEARQPLTVTVNKLSLPAFRPVARVLLQPGATATTAVSVERNGYEGPLELRVEGLPAKVTAKVESLVDGQDQAALTVTAASDAANVNQKFRIAATRAGRDISLEIPLQIDAQPYQVNSFKVVTLKPGETQRVEIPITRRSYKGAITLEAQELPAGVAVAKADVDANATSAALDFVAAPNAEERVKSVKIVSTAGALNRTDWLVLRISSGESGALPKEITADPELLPLLRRGSYGGRLTTKSKQALLKAYGGTEESEAAVLRGLAWLAAHQRSDGGWSLKAYHEGVSQCDCHSDFEKEVVDSDTAATGFALLPFLGAGITHNRAPESPPELAQYQKVVQQGLAYLAKNQVMSKDAQKAGNLGGNLYSHVVGAMALAEGYGLSQDDRLKIPAQLAIRYMVESQHPKLGGWRYSPRSAGDMSATGWMFLGIRNGQLANLPIDRTALSRAEKFIDSCAAGPEEAKFSRYSYLPDQQPKLSLSAAGLLTRQYLGWKRDNPHLLAGVKYLMENLPPESGAQVGSIYYHYYATQVLHHMEGEEFDLWNHRMREHLIRTQQTEGHKAGSWNPEGSDWGSKGGRLYTTSLALMTLQVYYRHLPLYKSVIRGSGAVSSAAPTPAEGFDPLQQLAAIGHDD